MGDVAARADHAFRQPWREAHARAVAGAAMGTATVAAATGAVAGATELLSDAASRIDQAAMGANERFGAVGESRFSANRQGIALQEMNHGEPPKGGRHESDTDV